MPCSHTCCAWCSMAFHRFTGSWIIYNIVDEGRKCQSVSLTLYNYPCVLTSKLSYPPMSLWCQILAVFSIKIVASLLSSNIDQLLIHTKSAALTRIQYAQAHRKKYCSKAGLNSCPRKLVVEIVSTDIVGTLKCFYSKCSQNPCRKNIPTRLVVEGFLQA